MRVSCFRQPLVCGASAHAIRDTTYFIQTSPDFSTWITVQTNTPSTSTLEAGIPLPSGLGRQFYRMMQWR